LFGGWGCSTFRVDETDYTLLDGNGDTPSSDDPKEIALNIAISRPCPSPFLFLLFRPWYFWSCEHTAVVGEDKGPTLVC